ncbi:hypothetical protein [Spongiimicrobium sp. 3-5]|uniref:hypothetical protein n=1 Tax=Spongiimicrobium sp. 3-5 TaxID=3332596 RepID=UPI00397F1970
MKNLKIFLLLGLVVFIASCSEDDKLTIDVQETVTRGAIIRTITQTANFDMFRTEEVFDLNIDEQDDQGGALLDRVELSISFVDNNFEDEDGETDRESVAPVAFRTLAASDFSTGDSGLPNASFSYTMAEALTALGVALTQVLPGDQIVLDLQLFLTDGRSFGASDATGNVSGGSFFSSPYQYTTLVDDGIEFDIENVNANEISLTAALDDYEVNLSINDGADGALMQTLNVYRAFVDRSIVDDINVSEPEALFDTYDISALTLEEGARILNLVYTQEELYGDNLTFDDLGVNDEVQLRYEIVTADGRIVTTDENDTEYYVALIVSECVQLNLDAPFPGDYSIKIVDSFGDGWDGAFITVEIDGVGTDYTLEAGSEVVVAVNVPEGTTSLVFTYVPGNYENEHSYNILDPNGKSAASDGPNPAPGEIPILVCE